MPTLAEEKSRKWFAKWYHLLMIELHPRGIRTLALFQPCWAPSLCNVPQTEALPQAIISSTAHEVLANLCITLSTQAWSDEKMNFIRIKTKDIFVKGCGRRGVTWETVHRTLAERWENISIVTSTGNERRMGSCSHTQREGGFIRLSGQIFRQSN